MELPEQDKPSWVCIVTAAAVCAFVKGSECRSWGVTCQYRAHQEEDAEEYVSWQCAEAVHDLPLADGEENSKGLQA